jgi:L-fucose mutarotase
MLKYDLIHPEMLEALGRAGHGSRILIADGNYPFSTTLGKYSKLVSLNLTPGVVSATEVLQTLVTAVPIEAATVMATLKSGPYAMKEDPPIWKDFTNILSEAGYAGELDQLERFDFYKASAQDNVALTIATAEERIYANLLLTIGVVMP